MELPLLRMIWSVTDDVSPSLAVIHETATWNEPRFGVTPGNKMDGSYTCRVLTDYNTRGTIDWVRSNYICSLYASLFPCRLSQISFQFPLRCRSLIITSSIIQPIHSVYSLDGVEPAKLLKRFLVSPACHS